MPGDAGAADTPGLVGSAKRLTRTILGIVRTRLEIVGTEVEEERLRLQQLTLLIAGFAFCAAMAVLLFVILVVVLLWDTHRLATLGAFASLFLVAGILTFLALKRHLRQRPKLFATTIAELSKDLERLRNRA